MLSSEPLNTFSLILIIRQVCRQFKIILQILTSVVRQEKEVKETDWKKKKEKKQNLSISDNDCAS